MSAPRRSRHRALYLFLLVIAVSLWRSLHRQGPAGWPVAAEPEGDRAPPAVWEDPLDDLTRVLEERQNGHAPAPEPSSHRYAVKWTDRSCDVPVRHERRDLPFDQAVKDAGWMVRHTRRFYGGDRSSRSPFAELRVYLQCLCGRDVTDLKAPHTVPGEDRFCPWSGTARSSEAISSLLTTLH